MSIHDRFGRPLGALRISVTDRCNLRCHYCMPADHYRWLPTQSVLSFDEIVRVARAFVALGVHDIRLTGGEPLLRPGLADLVHSLAGIPGVADLALTTNGTRLAPHAAALRQAGLHRITVSLDTLNAEAMRRLTKHGRLDDVLAGLDAATAAGFTGTKLNIVVIRGVNDHLLSDLVRFASHRSLEARFIEYMDVGGASAWRPELVVSGSEIIEGLGAEFGGATRVTDGTSPHAPATRWRLGTGQLIGVITSTTAPFCRQCDRSRLTADGRWYTCLYATEGVDLRPALGEGASLETLLTLIRSRWERRIDRGAELRLETESRTAWLSRERLTADPHLEMHVRGG